MSESSHKQLYDAVSQLHVSIVKQLLAIGASVTDVDDKGYDPLYYALIVFVYNHETLEKKHTIIRLLIEYGAEVNKAYPDLSGFTPLIFTSSDGDLETTRLLVELGASINKPDDYGFTPLHRAALSGWSKIIKFLLKKGADPFKKNNYRKTPLQLALAGRKTNCGATGSDFEATITLLESLDKNGLGNGNEKSVKKMQIKVRKHSETLKAMKEKFKPYKVPYLLTLMCRYWDSYPLFFCGSFEFDFDPYDGLKEWFRNIEAGYLKVRVFGHDGLDSLYAFWFYDEKIPENAPVVYLSGEGEGSSILADNFKEFLTILATNREYSPFDKTYTPPIEETADQNMLFKNWLLQETGLKPVKDLNILQNNVLKNHPDFKNWLKSVFKG